MAEPLRPDPQFLLRMAWMKMPYGKYRGCYLSELPEAYLVWFRQQGWPEGELGLMLASCYEIAASGSEALLRRIRQIEPDPFRG